MFCGLGGLSEHFCFKTGGIWQTHKVCVPQLGNTSEYFLHQVVLVKADYRSQQR